MAGSKFRIAGPTFRFAEAEFRFAELEFRFARSKLGSAGSRFRFARSRLRVAGLKFQIAESKLWLAGLTEKNHPLRLRQERMILLTLRSPYALPTRSNRTTRSCLGHELQTDRSCRASDSKRLPADASMEQACLS